MTPFQWGPSPPEPESYSATSTGTPAPLSPDVAELVRRVRNYCNYAGVPTDNNARKLADACERLADAARLVLDWYDRDGSVGGACDPMEALRAALNPRTEGKR